MARREHDRDDFLAEATALVQRVELSLSAFAEPVIIGFRANGCGSVYFGPDLAYHFNSQGELRRAHEQGILYKSERGALVRLERRRGGHSVELLRSDLDREHTRQFLANMADRLDRLHAALSHRDFHVIAQVPAAEDLAARSLAWLKTLTPPVIARSAHAR